MKKLILLLVLTFSAYDVYAATARVENKSIINAYLHYPYVGDKSLNLVEDLETAQEKILKPVKYNDMNFGIIPLKKCTFLAELNDYKKIEYLYPNKFCQYKTEKIKAEKGVSINQLFELVLTFNAFKEEETLYKLMDLQGNKMIYDDLMSEIESIADSMLAPKLKETYINNYVYGMTMNEYKEEKAELNKLREKSVEVILPVMEKSALKIKKVLDAHKVYVKLVLSEYEKAMFNLKNSQERSDKTTATFKIFLPSVEGFNKLLKEELEAAKLLK